LFQIQALYYCRSRTRIDEARRIVLYVSILHVNLALYSDEHEGPGGHIPVELK
jgi:hypothetical protein